MRAAVVGAALALVAAGSGVAGADGGAQGGGDLRMHRSARFAPPQAFVPSSALTYDQELVPAGAHITVRQRVDGEGTTVGLAVRGLAPDHAFGVHVHTEPCGPRPQDSGPHYRHVKAPDQPSADPEYANPENEVWLDFRTDGRGDGGSSVSHSWDFRRGEAGSVVLHEHAVSTEPGEAGTAGAPVGCFTVPFMGVGQR
ncbi:superoxide dismutase family protein [Streptomyces sp. N2-109]|uniref:Superoxide dismutase family protein n=1 Tax=Streptomyces gossypii TaxID=2883101 RepID=A0ABT2JQS2_9ACTN|nr:superoxide dismutase family protein [Streptomyces gossypii]MCT2590226.1 superoxide dismutase family protein [Streptomyces gossypii]